MSETARMIAALASIAVLFVLIQLVRFGEHRHKKRSRALAEEIGSPSTDTAAEFVDKLIDHRLQGSAVPVRPDEERPS